MEKREAFAVNLRKNKKAQILALKRKKITRHYNSDTADPQHSNSSSYTLYHKFLQNNGLMSQLLREIAPDHGAITGSVSF